MYDIISEEHWIIQLPPLDMTDDISDCFIDTFLKVAKLSPSSCLLGKWVINYGVGFIIRERDMVLNELLNATDIAFFLEAGLGFSRSWALDRR